MKAFDYALADSRAGATAALASGYKVKAAGVDLLDMLKERTEPAGRLVSILGAGELRGIEKRDGGIVIAPLATLREIAMNADVRALYPALALAAGHAATPQIRAVATAGGNILQRPRCWYFRGLEFHCLKKGGAQCFAVEGDNTYHAIFGDGSCHIVHPSNIAPALVAARAELTAEKAGKERVIKAGDFFLMPKDRMDSENALDEGELLTSIRIPKAPEKSGYIELREKQSFDWPLATCVAAFVDGAWNVVLGAVAPIPWRAKKAEAVLAGTVDITPDMAEKAAEAALDGAKPMSQNAWRLKLARAAVRRALLTACGKEAV